MLLNFLTLFVYSLSGLLPQGERDRGREQEPRREGRELYGKWEKRGQEEGWEMGKIGGNFATFAMVKGQRGKSQRKGGTRIKV